MRRHAALLSALIALFSICVLPPRVSAASPAALAAPAGLSMSKGGSSTAVAEGSWINTTGVDFHFQMPTGAGSLSPQVEIQPSIAAFTGHPTVSGSPLSSGSTATLSATLQNGKTYHWQARVVDGAGNSSPWISFGNGNGFDLGVDQDSPTRPTISSPSDPNQNRWYNTRIPSLQWSAHDALSGVRGYTFALERHPHVIPPGPLTSSTAGQVKNLADGVWFFALRAVDAAGNWSPTATFRLQLDRSAPRIAWLSPTGFHFNPYRGATSVRFRVSEPASVSLALYRVGQRVPTATFRFAHVSANRAVTLVWTGRNPRGHIDPTGYYFFTVRAIDRAHNITRVKLGGIQLVPQAPQPAIGGVPLYPDGGKLIVVVLHQQRLYAYSGTHLVLQTLVTTGNPSLPTPTGNYHVMARYHPFEFISPWPVGSPYYYAPSWVQYALLFREGGYFLHDAPWRSVFGPGSNGPGQPGTDYGGTHGCVNIPPSAMTFLWNWTPIGTPVDVVS